MAKMDLSKFKKVSADDLHTILRHKAGHEIKLNHQALDPKMRKDLEKLQMAEGGEAKPFHGYNPNKHAKTGGLNDKYREKYNREHGSHLQRPSKDKDNPRHKSFCARMKGVKGPTSKDGKLTPKGASLKRWNCHADGGEIEMEHDVPCTCGAEHEAHGGEMRQSNPKLEESKKVPHYAEGGEAEDDLDVSPVSQDAVEYEEAGAPPSSEEISSMQQTASPDMSAAQAPSINISGAQGEALRQAAGVSPAPRAMAATLPPSSAPKEMEPEIPTPRGALEQAKQNIQIQDQMNKLEQDKNRAMAAQVQAQVKIQEEAAKKIEEISNRQDKQMVMMLDEIKNNKIDPNRLWSSMDVGQKTVAGLALFLGGFASGFGGGPNVALDFLNKQIDRDIDAQARDKSDKMNLYKINLQLLGDEKAAAMKTKMEKLNILALQTNQKMLQATDQATKIRGAQLRDQLVQQAGQVKQGLVFKEYLKDQAEGHKLVQMSPLSPAIMGMVPEKFQKETFAEVKRAMDTRHISKTALESYDRLAQAYSGLGKITGAIYEPAESGALRDLIAQTVGDKTGSVRELAFHEAMNAYMPQKLDTAERSAKRRELFEAYLTSKQAAPTFESFTGIPLDRFASAATAESARASGAPMGAPKLIEKLYEPTGQIGLFDASGKFVGWKK